MPYCKECGAGLKEEQTGFCPYCGAALTKKPFSPHPEEPPDKPPPVRMAPAVLKLPEKQETETDRDETAEDKRMRWKSERVMTTAAYFWSLLLLAVPVAGLVAGIVWAAGGTASENRRNLGRAYLLLLLAGMITAVTAYFIIGYYVIRTRSPSGDLYGFLR